MNQRQNKVARISYSSGEVVDYTDPEQFLKDFREELPYRSTTGMMWELLTTTPTVRKAVDDELYDLFGEENPRPLEDYKVTGPEMGLGM